jgi:hypothetical protein
LIKGIYDSLKKESKNRKDTLLSTSFKIYDMRLKRYIDHPDLELTTGIRKRWFIKLYKLLSTMGKAKSATELAILNRNKELYEKSVKAYDKSLESFKRAYKKPEKIPEKEMERLREEKEEREEKERKKRRRRR